LWKGEDMGVGVSIFLIAVGAILTFAVEVNNPNGVNLDTIGIILMVVGGIGLLAALTVLNDSTPWRRREVIEEEPGVVVRRRR
jgi:uncharacterized membrane protein YhiD involved in acid resistance